MAVAFRYIHEDTLNLLATDVAAHYMCAAGGAEEATNTTEADAQALIRQAYTALNLGVTVATLTGTYTATVTGRDSGVSGALTVSLAAAGITEDTSNTMTLASGDLFNTVLATSGIGHSEQLILGGTAVTLQHATDGVCILTTAGRATQPISTTATLFGVSGAMEHSSTTEANKQRTFRTAATLAKLFVRCTGASSPVSQTFTTRVNGAPGGQSVAPNAAGTFEDTSNTDTIAVGDEVNYRGVTSSGSFSLILAQVQSTSSAKQHGIGAANFNLTVDIFLNLNGGTSSTPTEADVETTMRTTNVLKNFYTYVSAYSLDVAATARMRINRADNALGVSPNATGVWEDTSNTITLVATDEANFNADAVAASSGSITCTVISVEETQPVSDPFPTQSGFRHRVQAFF